VQKAKASGNDLSRDAYVKLAQPSENVPVTYFATVEPGLYRAILTRCVDPESRSCMTRVDLSPHESRSMPMNEGTAGMADTSKPQPHSD
jgi:cytochrome o ubiquinol oxidase subunit 2